MGFTRRAAVRGTWVLAQLLHFTWAEHGEALLRRRKPRYYESEPRPDRTVIGARLGELIGR